MSLLDIHVLGSPVLRAVTTPVAGVTDEHRKLIDAMFETMYAAQGIGLAAPQVGRIERIAVVDVEKNPIVIVNPEIILQDEETARAEEGCLSIPDVYGDVVRPTRVVVRALDREGKPFETEGTELLGRALQHEIDHLHGKLFIDYLSFLKRRSVLAKREGMKEKYPGMVRKLPLAAPAADRAHEDEIL